MIDKKKILLSIGIAAFNSEKTIEMCLNSILSQASIYVEVVFVDDGSLDKTFLIAREKLCSSGIPFSCSRHEKNVGIAITRKEIIESSNGEYLTWLDSDDALCDNSIELILHYIRSSIKPTGFIYNAVIKKKKKKWLLYNYGNYCLDSNLAVDYISTDTLFKSYPWTTVVPTKLIPSITLPTNPIDYVDDQLIVHTFFSNVQVVQYISKPICEHIIYESSDSHNSLFFIRLSRTFDYLYKQSTEHSSLIKNVRKIDFLKSFYHSIYLSSSHTKNVRKVVMKESRSQRKKGEVKKILSKASTKVKIEYLTFIYFPMLFYLFYRRKTR